ncbi:MAG: hypothetical protein II021_02150 [Oscillospiraceae bacterium]|nr:hypothetical protein [Oscillospiraceae bacterium]
MKIEVLYPELCNLYGDLYNAEYLARSAEAEIVNTKLTEKPRFISEKIDLLYLGGTTERGQEIARDALRPYVDEIKKRTAEGGVTLVTGNALEIFGEYIEEENGNKIEMLGLYPIHATRHMLNRYNALYLGELEGMKIVGFKGQFGHSYGDNGTGLFTTIRGAGLNPEAKAEGIRDKNLMMTYLIGPLLVLNPPFTKYLLGLMGVSEPTLACEKTAIEVYERRLRDFSEPGRNFVY